MIDTEGYRANVGIILSRNDGQVFWARRIGQDAWQFPQGGIKEQETPEQALFRELREEVGLLAEHVRILGSTQGWLRYKLPKWLMRKNEQPLCVGQKQIWYLLQLDCSEENVKLDLRKNLNLMAGAGLITGTHCRKSYLLNAMSINARCMSWHRF